MIEYTTEDTKLVRWGDRRQIEKKVLPEYYKGIRTHKKMFEIRKDEDDIKPGDILVLREWDGEKYTGGRTRREVTAVLRDCPEYGLMPGYVILSLQVPGWDYLKTQACSSVNPQEPKTGHWIETDKEYYKAVNEYGGGVNENTPYFVDDIACSECLAKYSVIDNETERFDHCPNCGCRMVEPQESEDKCINCANNGMIDDECAYCTNHNLFKAESEGEG